jgi:AraC-like DNA-binding protein/mannose-6-phosphate isomerase-like protein (cupin superfamily)
MLKEYSISDILTLPSQHIPYYAGTFEGTEDPEIEWPHRHSFFSLVWFTAGSGFYVIDFEEYEIKPNRIFFVSPKQVHNWDYSENCSGYILTIDSSLGKELNLNCLFPYLDINGNIESLFKTILPDLIENFQNKSDIKIDIQYIHQQLERFAQQIKYYTTNPYIIHFKKLISDNSKMLSVERCAEELHLSADELNSLCKEYTGTSAKQYLIEIKLTEAKRLLLYSEYNINEIAYNLGFEDSSYFSRIFKKKTTLSPSDFLKKYRKQG